MTAREPVLRLGGRMWRTLALSVGMLVLVPAAGSRLVAQRVEYSAGVAATRGTFIFTEPTTSWVLDQGLTFGTDRWRFGATLPIVRQNSSAITYIGGLPLPTGGPYAGAVRGRTDGSRVPMSGRGGGAGGHGGGGTPALQQPTMPQAALVDSGAVEATGPAVTRIGDPVLTAATELTVGASGAARVGAHVLAKVPVADVASGIGTGRFDYGAGLSLSLAGPRTFAFAEVNHWVLGDLPDLPLRDLTSASAGLGRAFGEMGRLSLLASVSGATAIVEEIDPTLSVGVSAGLALGSRRFATVGATIGLSESAPDWGASIGWRVAIGPR